MTGIAPQIRLMVVALAAAGALLAAPATAMASHTLIPPPPTGITNGGGLIKVNVPNHGLTTGETITVAGATPAGANGNRPVTVVDANSFTLDGTTYTQDGGRGSFERRPHQGALEIQKFTVIPKDLTHPPSDPPLPYPATQAGGHPDTEISFRLCDPPGGPRAGGGLVGFETVNGCTQTPGQVSSTLKDFNLHLPPGMLGNPTAVATCPTHLFIAFSCPIESQVGYAYTHAVQPEAGDGAPLLDITTGVYNLETLGLEPARLGAGAKLSSDPPGPLPVVVSLRSSGTNPDFGVSSTVYDVPFKLGSFAAKASQIDTVLCSYAPCAGSHVSNGGPVDVAPLAGAKPFFLNPAQCERPATMRMDAVSYFRPLEKASEVSNKTQTREPADINGDGIVQDQQRESHVVDHRTTTFTPTGCENVPFDLDVTTTPDTQQAGAPTGMAVKLDYGEYADDPIWQAQLKDADVTLPQGVSLSPAGGVGLEQCTFDQFGMSADGKTISDAPVKCPPGSHIGDITVEAPVLPTPIHGKAFFGPTGAPGRPTEANPWKLFLLLEGHGLRLKLPPGDVSVTESGQIRTVFRNNPEVPFTTFTLRTRGGDNAVLMNPRDCGEHLGSAVLTSHASNVPKTVTPKVTTTGCQDPEPFQPVVEEASAAPTQAGAFSVSRLVMTRPDGHQMMKGLKLSLPPGAAGSLANAPLCPAGTVNALASTPGLNCPDSSKVGTIKSTVGYGNGLLTVPGSIYIGEAVNAGDAASFVIVIPAKVGPIDLGRVVLVNRAVLREADTGVDVLSPDIPTILGGVPLPLRKIEIVVDKDRFFFNPTGCDTRTFTATFTSDRGVAATSSHDAAATGCEALPFQPRLRIIAGGNGLTQKDDHPNLKAIVTQRPGEANISKARVVIPDIIRPNVPQFQKPGALCNDSQLATRTCPALSQVGTASVITPVLPFKLSGPVYIVQESGKPLPKLAVMLRGGGLEVVLNARNGFSGIKILNTFDSVPDVPQSRFELNVKGGPNGILNVFNDLCTTRPLPTIDAQFTGHNGKVYKELPRLQTDGCVAARARASISGRRVKMSKTGVIPVRVTCPTGELPCRGRLRLQTAGRVETSARRKLALGSKTFNIPAGKTRTVKVKVANKVRRVVRRYRNLRVRATVRLNGARTTNRTITVRGR